MLCAVQLLEDLIEVLGPLSQQQRLAYNNVTEVYSTSRMLLAVLPPDLLPKICSSWNCDLSEVRSCSIQISATVTFQQCYRKR